MRQSLRSVFPETPHDDERPRRKTRAPVTERVAGWSARRRKTAVVGWLLLVAVVLVAAAVLIDAAVVRGVLLPAALSLLGGRAWRLRRGEVRSPRERRFSS